MVAHGGKDLESRAAPWRCLLLIDRIVVGIAAVKRHVSAEQQQVRLFRGNFCHQRLPRLGIAVGLVGWIGKAHVTVGNQRPAVPWRLDGKGGAGLAEQAGGGIGFGEAGGRRGRDVHQQKQREQKQRQYGGDQEPFAQVWSRHRGYLISNDGSEDEWWPTFAKAGRMWATTIFRSGRSRGHAAQPCRAGVRPAP